MTDYTKAWRPEDIPNKVQIIVNAKLQIIYRITKWKYVLSPRNPRLPETLPAS